MEKVLRCEPETLAACEPAGTAAPLARLAALIGPLVTPLSTDRFETLARTIVGQQLSVKAAATIWGRVAAACGAVAPDRLLALTDEEWRAFGVSKPKASYIRDLAAKVAGEVVRLDELDGMEDAEVIRTLMQVKGIGLWTAEMFLIFSLGRTDVRSLGDAGLQRAARWLLAAPDISLRDCFDRWSPHGSIASLYLWEAVNRGWVDAYGSLGEAEQMLPAGPEAAASPR